jgi:hypothetical protein
MTPATSPRHPTARTVLEAEIRELNMTIEEFAEYAETISRQDPNTGSVRHLQRLITGADPDRLRPATKRLLERIFTRRWPPCAGYGRSRTCSLRRRP